MSDWLTEFDEEEQEAELWFPDSDDEKEEKRGGPSLPLSPPIRNKPQRSTPLRFKLNAVWGSRVRQAEAAAEWLLEQRGGSPGFTSLLASPPPSSTPPSLLPPEPTPVITGVVCGEAAERVLRDCGLPEPQGPGGVPERPQNPEVQPQPPQSPLCPSLSERQGRWGRRCEHCGSSLVLISKLRGFMCSCSDEILRSLKVHMIHWRWPKTKTTSPRPPRRGAHTPSPRPRTPSPQGAPRLGRLVLSLEEFYYGTDPGSANTPMVKSRRHYRCNSCRQPVGNNIQLMQHMERHAEVHREAPGNDITFCSFCYRRFGSPFSMQCHLEDVHCNARASAVCKICELSFVDERELLNHMKETHRPGEMPYACQLCGFRASFHGVVRGHFEAVHSGQNSMLCLYCLKVHHSSDRYQDHLGRHQRRGVFRCSRCRLYFLSAKERTDHKRLHHRTHLLPPQLLHLTPGTTVTVRAYSVVGGKDEPKDGPAPSKVTGSPRGTAAQEPPRMKPLERQSLLPSQSKTHSQLTCVECMSDIPDASHFLSPMHCSRCKYLTHCLRAYANHMISDHATRRTDTKYTSLFQHSLGCVYTLRCASCGFTTRSGDLMANHMRDHAHLTAFTVVKEGDAPPCSSRTDCQTVTLLPAAAGRLPDAPCSEERRDRLLSGGGAFVPIHLLSSGPASTRLSVTVLDSLPPPCFSPALTIRVRGPRHKPAQRGSTGGSPGGGGVRAVLGPDQLQEVLLALCSGLPQAARRYGSDPTLLQAWILQREQDLRHRTWDWDTEPVAEWILVQREKQVEVQESSLLQVGVAVLGGVQYEWGGLGGWAVDLMLHHHLSLQPAVQSHDSTLPRPFLRQTMRFLRQLNAQIQTYRPGSVGCVDELSVFLDPRGGAALQLFGRSESRCCADVVLSGLADGTFLKPVLFFTGPEPRLPSGFPDNVLLEARPDGFTDQQRLQLWFTKVWRPHAELGRDFHLLLLDQHRGHQGAEFKASLGSSSTLLAPIPMGCSAHLQPLDACVTPVVREFFQARWSQLMSQNAPGALQEAELALMLACWLSEVASTLDRMPQVLSSPFQKNLGHMITALTESLIGHPQEPMRNQGGDAAV